MTDRSPLSPRERAKRYRELSRDALLRAARLKGDERAASITFAGTWEQLALEAEAKAEDESGNLGFDIERIDRKPVI